MTNLKALRTRIKSVKNTTKITKTMALVAASKMKKAQSKAKSMKMYTEELGKTISNIPMDKNKFTTNFKTGKALVVLIASDRGLSGSLQTNLIKLVSSYDFSQYSDLQFVTLGKKADQYVLKTGKTLSESYPYEETLTFEDAKTLSTKIKEMFFKQKFETVYLVYNTCISTLKQIPTIEVLIPLPTNTRVAGNGGLPSPATLAKGSALVVDPPLVGGDGAVSRRVPLQIALANDTDVILEPNKTSLSESIINHSIDTHIFHAILEAHASEHSARMVAMQAATDNGKKLGDELTLFANQARQEAITKELLDIQGAGE
jgi:F-type H+-transporting ATPase subunit gamma